MSKDTSKDDKDKIWNPWLGVLVAAAALLGSQIVSGLLLSLFPLIAGWDKTRANNWLNNSTLAQFIFIIMAEAIILGSLYLFLSKYKNGFKVIGLRKPRWLDPVYGLAGLPLYLIIYFIVIGTATHFFPSINVNEKQQLGFNNVHGAIALIMTFISLVILPPIGEEIIFRGILYTSLKKIMPLWPAVIATSLLFAAGHLAEGGSGGLLYIAALDTFSLSLVLIYLREKTGGLYASMTLHAIKNCIAFAALFLVGVH